MQLTEAEKTALAEAKKLDARWFKTRWLALTMGLVFAAIGILCFVNFASVPVAAGTLIGLGIAQWILVLKVWNGRPILKLLIKLAAKNEEHSN
jgi:hypothetical protein